MFFLLLFFVLAGTIFFLIFHSTKKQEKVTIRNYANDLPRGIVHKKIDTNSVYMNLDTTEPSFYKVGNTEIANLIELSLPLNPWLKNPDSIYYNRDTIMWNYVAVGLGDLNARYPVTYGQSMWLIAKEIWQNNNYLLYKPIYTKNNFGKKKSKSNDFLLLREKENQKMKYQSIQTLVYIIAIMAVVVAIAILSPLAFFEFKKLKIKWYK